MNIKILFVVIILLPIIVLSQSKIDSLNLALKSEKGKERIKTLVELGFMEYETNPTLSLLHSNEVLEFAEKENNKRLKVKALNNISLANWSLNNYEKALRYNYSVKELYKELQDTSGICAALSNEGMIIYSKGLASIALEKFLSALEYSKAVKDLKKESIILQNIGVIYEDLDNVDQGLNYYLMSDSIARKNNFKNTMIKNNIGNCYIEKGEYKKAETYLTIAMHEFESEKNNRGLGLVYNNLGLINQKLKEYKAAEEYYAKALSCYKISENNIGIVTVLNSTGELKSIMGNNKEARHYFNESLKIGEKIHFYDQIIKSYHELSKSYKISGDYKKALEYFTMYSDSLESFNKRKSLERLAQIKFQFETKKIDEKYKLLAKENKLNEATIRNQKTIAYLSIALLLILFTFGVILIRKSLMLKSINKELVSKNIKIENQNVKIEKNNIILSKINRAKDIFFSVLAHDLKNHIGIISNLSGLFKDDFQELSEKEKIEVSKQIYSANSNVNTILENLILWGRSLINNVQIDKQKLNVFSLVQDTIDKFKDTMELKSIIIENKIPNDIEICTDGFMFQTIIGNLISNAIKFSYPHGLIEINSHFVPDICEISIKDFGIGMETETIDELFNIESNISVNGTNNEKGHGFGMILVKELVEQLSGSISVKSELSKGTELILNFPHEAKCKKVEAELELTN